MAKRQYVNVKDLRELVRLLKQKYNVNNTEDISFDDLTKEYDYYGYWYDEDYEPLKSFTNYKTCFAFCKYLSDIRCNMIDKGVLQARQYIQELRNNNNYKYSYIE